MPRSFTESHPVAHVVQFHAQQWENSYIHSYMFHHYVTLLQHTLPTRLFKQSISHEFLEWPKYLKHLLGPLK